jgi:predicted Rossmann fold nucleotide-binding protein DprA/Smf involved in DNA uptake
MSANAAPARLERGAPGYPPSLARLGSAAPQALSTLGNRELLREPVVALFCSVRAPGACVLAAYDLACGLRDAGVTVGGGFHSPLERECLSFLLRGDGRTVVCPARCLEGMRLPAAWRGPLAGGRMLLLSALPAGRRRATRGTCDARNELVAGLAAAAVILHATPGGRLSRLAGTLARGGRRVYCLDLPENDDLRLAGARACGVDGIVARLPRAWEEA